MKTEHNRQELDPITDEQAAAEAPEVPAPAPGPALPRADDPAVVERIDRLITDVTGRAGDFDARLMRDLLVAALKLIPDGRDTGELKLVTAAVKEMRYAMRVFGEYPEPHKVTIFGSARTPTDHPDYQAAVEYSRIMAEHGWMVITGAGDGIMRAGHEGPGREASFGVAIRLPFETTANEFIAGDDKLIHFRYFFTRKLMFLMQSEAVVCFPGGFGTLDETFETLTLVQTGKASMIPIVFVEGEPTPGHTVAGGDPGKAIAGYWRGWEHFITEQLGRRGWISPEDVNLYHIAKDPKDAAEHVLKFYRNYHSSRYVRDDMVIRIKRRLRDADVARLGGEFADIIKAGTIVQRGAYAVEEDHQHLPRLAFTHTRHKFGRVRQLIDRINECDPAE